MNRAEIKALFQKLGGMAALIAEAGPDERAALYADLGIRLAYDDCTSQIRATPPT